VSQRLVEGRHALVKAGRDGFGVAFEGSHVSLAGLFVVIEESLGFSDALRKVGDVDVVDLLDGLGDACGLGSGLGHGFGHSLSGGRHCRRDFGVAVLVR
jgi:hypothetical protein